MYRSTGLLSEIIDSSENCTIREVLLALKDEVGHTRPTGLQLASRSNDQLIIVFEDGRELVVKRLLHEYLRSARRLQLAQKLSDELEKQGIQSPRYLPLPEHLVSRGVRVYWRIALPTLEDVWPHLSVSSRKSTLKSAGVLIRTIHSIRPLPSDESDQDVAQNLKCDIENRLLRASYAHWPAGVPALIGLADLVSTFSRRINRLPSVLLHGDLHTGNLLCDPRSRPIQCTGILDLDDVATGPGEMDIAILEVNHGSEFGRPLSTFDLGDIMAGYGCASDTIARRCFRAYRLLNMGYHAAWTGMHEHAFSVARAAQHEVDCLTRLKTGTKPAQPGIFDHFPAALTTL